MKFVGDRFVKPSTLARRYVANSVASSIVEDLKDGNGWILGGLEDEPDIRRARAAAERLIAKLRKLGGA